MIPNNSVSWFQFPLRLFYFKTHVDRLQLTSGIAYYFSLQVSCNFLSVGVRLKRPTQFSVINLSHSVGCDKNVHFTISLSFLSDFWRDVLVRNNFSTCTPVYYFNPTRWNFRVSFIFLNGLICLSLFTFISVGFVSELLMFDLLFSVFSGVRRQLLASKVAFALLWFTLHGAWLKTAHHLYFLLVLQFRYLKILRGSFLLLPALVCFPLNKWLMLTQIPLQYSKEHQDDLIDLTLWLILLGKVHRFYSPSNRSSFWPPEQKSTLFHIWIARPLETEVLPIVFFFSRSIRKKDCKCCRFCFAIYLFFTKRCS